MDTTNYSYAWNNFSENILITRWTGPLQQRIKDPHGDRVGEVETYLLPKNPVLGMMTPNQKRSQKYSTSPCGARGLGPTSDISTFGSCTGKMSPLNIKPWGIISRRRIELEGTENLPLRGSRADSHTLWPSAKTAAWKAPSPYVKQTQWLIVKWPLDRKECCWDSPGTEGVVGAIFFNLFLLANADTGGCHFSNLCLTCLRR